MNKKINLLILLSAILLNFSLINVLAKPDTVSIEKYPRISFGVSIPFIFNINNGLLKNDAIDVWCCNDLTISNLSFNSGINLTSSIFLNNIYKIPLFDSLSWGFKADFGYQKNYYSGSVTEPPRYVTYKGDIVPLLEQNNFKWSCSLLTFNPSVIIGTALDSLRPFSDSAMGKSPNYYFSLGPVLYILVSQNAVQSVEIQSPTSYTYLDNTREKTLKSKVVNNSNDILLGVNLSCGTEWYLRQFYPTFKFQNLILSSELFFKYFITHSISTSNINNFQIGINLGIKWQQSKLYSLIKEIY